MPFPLSFYSLATQRLLSQTSNIGYAARGVYRTSLAGDDRKADNNFRDFQMSFLTNILSEMGFRGIQSWYVVPRMTEALGLNRLSEIYADRHPGVTIKNYDRLPEIIRNRMMGTLVRAGSMSKVPDLIEGLETELLNKNEHGLSSAEQTQLRILLDHLHKNLNFKDYVNDLTQDVVNGRTLKPEEKLSKAEAEFVLKQSRKLAGFQGAPLIAELQEIIKAPTDKRAGLLKKLQTSVQDWHSTAATIGTEADVSGFNKLDVDSQIKTLMQQPDKKQLRALKTNLEEHFKQVVQNQDTHHTKWAETLDWAKELPDSKLSELSKQKLLNLVHDGITSDRVLKTLKHIQKNSTWPQMATSVVLSFMFYGLIANFFDVKVLQPWQEKLVKQRGSSEAYVKPSYMATGIAAAALGFGMQNKLQFNFIRKLGYFNRFAVVGPASLAVYLASFLLLLKRELAKPVQPKAGTAPQPQAALPSLPQATNPFGATKMGASPNVQ
jgi:hypothetical protein